MSTTPSSRERELAARFLALPKDRRQRFYAGLMQQGIQLSVLPIPRSPASDERERLSYAQERLWFLAQLDPESTAYNMAGALRLRGTPDVQALRRALRVIVQRHEVLRTRFETEAGSARARVSAEGEELLLETDARQQYARDGERAVSAWAQREAEIVFDLARGPLLRVQLVRFAEADYGLFVCMHHIVSDGWSLRVLIAELSQCYEHYARGALTEPALPALPIQYADYATWQRAWLEAGEREKQLQYWREQLAGEQRVLSLPADRPRPPVQSQRGAVHNFVLPATLAGALRRLAQEQGVTMFMLGLAAYKALLYRATAQTDLHVGSNVANRNRLETEGLIGFFVNTLVLRTRLAPELTFTQLLAAVKETVLAAGSHQDLPFEQLVDALAPERSLAHNPLFQVHYDHQGSAYDALGSLGGVPVEPIAREQRGTVFDLMLTTLEQPDGSIAATFGYATDLFDHSTIERLAARFTRVLTQVARAPQTTLAQLTLSDPHERVGALAVTDLEFADDESRAWLTEHAGQARRVQILDADGNPAAPGLAGELHWEVDADDYAPAEVRPVGSAVAASAQLTREVDADDLAARSSHAAAEGKATGSAAASSARLTTELSAQSREDRVSKPGNGSAKAGRWMASGQLARVRWDGALELLLRPAAATRLVSDEPRVHVAASSEIERLLSGVFCEVLQLEQVSVDDNFFELGGDSIISIQVVSRAREHGIALRPKDLFQHQTVRKLAAVAQQLQAVASSAAVNGKHRLTPIQQRFFARQLPEPDHFNQSVLLESREPLDSRALERALVCVVAQHDALRSKLERGPDGYRQQVEPAESLQHKRLLVTAHVADRAEISARCDAAQRSLSLARGEVMRALHLRAAEGGSWLLLVVHHLVIDGVSWRILLEDLQRAYAAILTGQQPQLPPRTAAFGAWAEQLHTYANSPELAREHEFWRQTSARIRPLPASPTAQPGDPHAGIEGAGASAAHTDVPASASARAAEPVERSVAVAAEQSLGCELGTVSEAERVEVRLVRAETERLLKQSAAAYRTQVHELLLVALSRALAEVFSQREISLWLEGHGREEVFEGLDLSRTVGWFTSEYPVVLTPSRDLVQSIKGIKEQLRAVPQRGFGYGVLAELGPVELRQPLQAAAKPSVAFNYLGQFDATFGEDALFGVAAESPGPELAESTPLAHPLEINGQVFGAELSLWLNYSPRVFTSATMQRLAASFERELRAVIEHCANPNAGGATPSDFPLAGLDQAELDALAAESGVPEDVYPVTPMQHGMLFHALYDSEPGVYVTQLSVEIEGLHEARFVQAWDRALQRHAILRTQFAWADRREPLQIVVKHAKLAHESYDLRGATDRDAQLSALAREQHRRAFALQRAPLWRVALVRLDEARHALIWTHHHLLLDGWSTARLLDEVLLDYLGRARPSTSYAFADYVAWLARRDESASEQFWRERLQALDEPTILASVLPRPESHGATLTQLDEPAILTNVPSRSQSNATASPLHEMATGPVLASQPPAAGATQRSGAPAAGAVDSAAAVTSEEQRSARGRQEVTAVDVVRTRLSAAETQALQALAQRERVTLNALVQAAWALLLQRYTGQASVVFGATTSGRPHDLAGSEQMLGLFINTLPVIVQAQPQAALSQLWQSVQEQGLLAREHEHTPLSKLQRWAGLAPGQSALFDTLIVFENFPIDSALQGAWQELSFGRVQTVEITNYALTLAVHPGQELELDYAFDPNTLAAPAVQQIAAQMLDWMRAFPRLSAELPLGHLTLAGKPALQRSHERQGDFVPLHQTLLERMRGRAAQHEPVVVGADGEGWTPAELERRVHALTRFLLEHGVTTDTRVGLYVQRGPWLIAGALAIWQAGGVFVPLDPAYPRERLAWMAADANLSLVLRTQGVPELSGCPNIDIAHAVELSVHDSSAFTAALATPPGSSEQAPQQLMAAAATQQQISATRTSASAHHHASLESSGQPASDARTVAAPVPRTCAASIHPQQLAYIIYTSGSTGTPKGVGVGHGALAMHVRAACALYGFSERDTALQMASASFDASVEQWTAPLFGGARVVLSDVQPWTGSETLAVLRRERVTVIYPPTSQLVALCQHLEHSGESYRLRVCCVGGEAISRENIALIRRNVTPELIINGYGPTETVITPLAWRATADMVCETPYAPIGWIIGDRSAYVLDAELNIQPHGVAGELYIGGSGVARGYLGRPRLTAERFVPDPFGDRPGARLYRTGDRVRALPDGTIEFLGRVDHQVKLRGYRIELGEIEARLLSERAVIEAVAVVRHDGGNAQLVGYVSSEGSDPMQLEAALMQRLRAELPAHMVPSRLMVLPELPHTPNGKIDRRALPAPALAVREHKPARTPLERELLGCFAEVLQTELGVSDDFFELGGDSLVSLQLVSRLRARGYVLSLREVFELRTVEALAAKLAPAAADGVSRLAIERVARKPWHPLSYAQERLWFLAQLEPESAAYNISAGLRMRGALNLEALRHAFALLVTRHEALRTRFEELDGQGVQRIEPEAELPLQYVDARGGDVEQRARALFEDEAARPFQLDRAPLMRVLVVQLAEQEHVLVVCVHHMIADGWSMRQLIDELARAYSSFATSGNAPELPPLDLQYIDYAAWQRQWLSQGELARQLAYWRAQLGATHEALELPLDRPRHAAMTRAGAAVDFALDAAVSRQLAQLAQRFGASTFMVLLAALEVVLYRLTGQRDLRVGVPMSNRNRLETESVVGLFVNTLVLRTELDGSLRFSELLARVKETALGAQSHQDLPFEQLVDALAPERSLSHNPLFQVMFDHQRAGLSPLRALPGLAVEPFVAGQRSVQFDLALDTVEDQGQITGSFSYATELFDRSTIEALAARFQAVLRAALTDPELRVAELPLIAPSERDLLLSAAGPRTQASPVHPANEATAEHNTRSEATSGDLEGSASDEAGTGSWQRRASARSELGAWEVERLASAEVSAEHRSSARFEIVPGGAEQRARASQCELVSNAWAHELVQHRIDAQAQLRPDAVALEGEASAERWSYARVELVSNQWAHELIALGVKPEARVGLCMTRGPEQIVAALAIFKAGGAYLPLDPSYPAERLRAMVEDAGVELVVSDGLQPVAATLGVACCRLRDLAREARRAREQRGPEGHTRTQRPQVALSPDNLAYVIYTSGSTGRPKGVAVTHSALARHIAAIGADYGMRPDDCALHFASMGFDAGVEQWVSPLCHGAKLFIRGDELWSAERALEVLRERRVTWFEMPPGYLTEVARAALARDESLQLRACTAGGEAVSRESLAVIMQAIKPAPLINGYGPTEAVITPMTWRCEDPAHCKTAYAPIGRVVGPRRAYVLDADLNLVPRGVTGDLYLAGSSNARGYLGRAALTAERFIPDPYADEAGAIMYRTGDLARVRPDGEVEYVGRADHQVKLRGFRIELGEIEAQLLAHPGVREAVVVAEGGAVATRLLGYLAGDVDLDQLRVQLRASLPEYMVPTQLIALPALPRNDNGKIDRKRLPKVQAEAEAYVAPESPREAQLCAIIAEVLGLPRVGLRDDFFALGGDSIRSLQVISRARKLGLALRPRDLFEARTVAELAQLASSLPLEAAPELARLPRTEELFALSYAQERMWFLAQLDPDSSAYNIPSALRVRGELDRSLLQQALDALIARHETLRTSFVLQDGAPLQRVHAQLELPISYVDLSDQDPPHAERRARELVEEQAHTPFDLTRAPLLRVALVRLPNREHVMSVVVHHIVSDGWSMDVAIAELTELYNAARSGGSVSMCLPALPVQYVDYAAWQRTWLQGPERERQLKYWTEVLGDEHPVLSLPLDQVRASASDAHGAVVERVLDAELGQALQALARAQGVSMFMLLLAAWQTLLHKLSGQNDIRVGVPITNRSRVETERLIGLFVNTQVLRSQISGEQRFGALLQEVKRAALGASAHRDLPFEQLVEALQPARSLGQNPLFQVTFNHASAAASVSANSSAPFELSAFSWQARTTQFDLSLDTEELAGHKLRLAFTYAADIFAASSIERIADRLQLLLRQIVREPARRIAELELLQDRERASLMAAGLPRQAAPELAPQFVHEAIATQARSQPDATALLGEDGQRYSYAQLDRLSNQWAQRLRALGVGPESKLGLCLTRTPRMVMGALAILKAGGAYVPLDPSYPLARLRAVVEDAGVQLILGEQAAAPCSQLGAAVVLCDREDVSGYPVEPPQVALASESLAYVIYTSGSTGRPKGVGVSHGALAQHIAAIGQDYGMRADDCALHFASIGFDAGSEQWISPLVHGARLFIRGDELWSAERALSVLRENGVTWFEMPPGYLHEIARAALERGERLQLRACSAGGEAVSREALQTMLQAVSPAEVINGYGPTETVITPMTWHARDVAQCQTAYAPIGRVVGPRRSYVLDADLNLAPAGVIGELYLSGLSVARGYIGRPDLTAERFVPDPFSEVPGARMYRTGDLARVLSDGEVEYIGRADHQVKVRGFRVELGEIEAQILEAPGVRAAVVLAQGGGAIAQRLVAYVVGELEPDALKARLTAALPAYMVPSHWVLLPELPRTPNGKVDRKQLPEPDAAAESFSPPVTAIEHTLAAIWQDVLQVSQVGLTDNFFELGGHSLLVMRVVTHVQAALGVELSVRDLFETDNLQELAALVERTRSTQHVMADAVAESLSELENMSEAELAELLNESEE